MMVGAVYERSHSREVSDNLGLGKYLPAYMGFWGLFAFSSFAFPGTNSFVGELLVMLGAFQIKTWIGLAIVPGALLAAAYMLRLTQKMAWGVPASAGKWKDLNKREWAYLLPLAFFVLYIGLVPAPFFRVMNASLTKLANRMQSARPAIAESIKQPAAKTAGSHSVLLTAVRAQRPVQEQ
jgi:NADH-quinone oxidoreductase subunit M